MTTSDSLLGMAGASAFPNSYSYRENGDEIQIINHGMTLRDYFAAKAMAALVASNDEGAGDRIEEIPTYAYQIADAMLKARGEDRSHEGK